MADLFPESLGAAIERLERDRQPYALATLVWTHGLGSAKAGSRAVITAAGELRGWVGGACTLGAVTRTAQEVLESGEPLLLRVAPPDSPAPPGWDAPHKRTHTSGCASRGTYELFVEPRLPAPQLVILGDTPLACRLGELAKVIGYRVIAVVQGPQQRPEADLRLEQTLEGITFDDETFVVVASLGQWDKTAAKLAVGCPAEFVSLVASPARWAQLKSSLADQFSAEQLGRVAAPAGLDLGRIRHEEIAVSVLAEIVQQRAARRAAPHSQPDQVVSRAVR